MAPEEEKSSLNPSMRTATPGPTARSPKKLKIGLALGAGAARGWAHIGVLRELLAHGVRPDVVAGTSMGAVVGGCYAAEKLDQIELFARSLTRRRVFTLMDLSFTGGSLIAGTAVHAALAMIGRLNMRLS
jgi:NTE family protein